MNELIIWTIDGQVRTIYVTGDMLEYEEQVLVTDPMVKEWAVNSL